MKRVCNQCGQVDDHPRHMHIGGDGEAMLRHMDCCSAAGCPDGSCDAIIQTIEAKNFPKGDALRAHLTSGKVDHIGRRLNEERARHPHQTHE